MFGVTTRVNREAVANGNGVCTSSDDDQDDIDEGLKARRSKLCSIRKRSVEIPLENLLSGVVYLSGGRDTRGGPVLSIAQPDDVELELLMEVTMDEITDMLAYFTFVPSEEVRNRKFSVVIAADLIHDFFLRKIIKALNIFENDNHLFHEVYVLCSSRDLTSTDYLNWACNFEDHRVVSTEGSNLKIIGVKSSEELQKYIAKDQLTENFGGTFQYDHQDWVKFRMKVEPFICDVVGVSKRLVEAITPFTEEDNPSTIQEAEESLKAHRYQRRKTFDTLHVEELASEGERIKERLHMTSKEHLRVNPDFNATLKTIEVLLSRVENVRTRLDELWKTKNDKLETKIKEKKFEKEANQIIEWFEQYAEEFFETNTDLGDSLEVAQALVNELMEFEENTKEILQHTDILLKQASKLQGIHHVSSTVQELGKKIKGYLIEYNLKMENRKKKLNKAVILHNIMEKAVNWCIQGVEFLGDYDILGGELGDMNPAYVKDQLNQFNMQVASPSDDEIKMLTEAVSSMERHWGKESFQFALNRIIELRDRFELYHKLLDDMIASKESEDDTYFGINNPDNRMSTISSQSNGSDTNTPETFSPSPPIVGRRTSTSGKEVQVTVLDIDKSVQQAISLLETTNSKTQLLNGSPKKESSPSSCNGPDCLSIVDFLNELELPNSESSTSLLSLPETRSRSYSAPEESTDGEIKRSRSFNRKSRQTISHHSASTPSKHLDISMPSNPKFEDQPEKVSLDDITVEENPEDMTAQTANARHRRKLMEELITTEESYIKDLEHVCKHYLPIMDDAENLPPELVDKKGVIFGLLPVFLKFSRDVVLPRIRKCMRAPIKMGLVFLDHEEDILEYAMYFKHKPQQDELITKADRFFRTVQLKIDDPMSLFGYLIKPVQRMTKYKQFLEQMIKYSSKGKDQHDIQIGSKKEYFDKLKEALKMIDFVLRHGNDLLAIESLRGCEASIDSLGRILRVGNLTIIDGFTKHHRKVFLFEKCILFTKARRIGKTGPTGSDVYDFKQMFKTADLVLRENIPGHDARFALEMKKLRIELQAESADEKQEWVQEIWDLFFSHMLKLRDDNLQTHGTRGLSTPMLSGDSSTLTRGRPLSHSMRKAKRLNTVSTPVSMTRHSAVPRNESSDSISSIGSATSLMEVSSMMRNSMKSRNFHTTHIRGSGPISPRSSLTTFHNRYSQHRMSELSGYSSDISSNRDSISSTVSIETLNKDGRPNSQHESSPDPHSTLKGLENGGTSPMTSPNDEDRLLWSETMALGESVHLYNTPV